jgi:hypothetical protein
MAGRVVILARLEALELLGVDDLCLLVVAVPALRRVEGRVALLVVRLGAEVAVGAEPPRYT